MQNPNPVGKDSSVYFGDRLTALGETLTKLSSRPNNTLDFRSWKSGMGKTLHSEYAPGNVVSFDSKAQEQPKQRMKQNKKAL